MSKLEVGFLEESQSEGMRDIDFFNSFSADNGESILDRVFAIWMVGGLEAVVWKQVG